MSQVPLFEAVDLIIAFFAVYRVSMMLHHDGELGPNQWLYRLKIKLGVEESSNGDLFGRPGTLQEALLCYFCNSPWIGLGFAALYAALLLAGQQTLARLLCLPLAASGFTIALGRYTER